MGDEHMQAQEIKNRRTHRKHILPHWTQPYPPIVNENQNTVFEEIFDGIFEGANRRQASLPFLSPITQPTQIKPFGKTKLM